VVKPVEPRVLLAAHRGAAAPRAHRPSEAREARLTAGRLSIDGTRRSAAIGARTIELTTGDFDILWLLASRAGQRGDARRDPARGPRHRLRRPRPLHRRAHLPPAQEAAGSRRRRVDDQDRRLRGYLFAGEG
jgi:hypothetical protein